MAIEPLQLNPAGKRDGAWFYVVEPEGGAHAPIPRRIRAGDGGILTKRPHGHEARVEVRDETGLNLSPAALLRAAAGLGHALTEREDDPEAQFTLTLGPQGTPASVEERPEGALIRLDGDWIVSSPSHHPINDAFVDLLQALPPQTAPGRTLTLPDSPTPRALFFEALMNTDTPHNHTELSQGVLHMISPLKDLATEVVLADVKMPIVGDERPVLGLENLEAALVEPVGLVCITLLEGYWEGVVRLIETIRSHGCRAHIAVGGVMPTLAPEHVAAHLPDVSFVCRGAGERTVRRLVEILGDTDVDTPFTASQRTALLQMNGVLAWDRSEGALTLLAANPAHTEEIQNLDSVPLDLEHLQSRHLLNGVELCTSRGCIHKCTFCTIIGRQAYMSRSAENLTELLGNYVERYQEIYEEGIPSNAFKLHLSDDDFACDKPRAAEFFKRILETPFRLSSVQVAISDLCKREGSRLTAEPDHEFLDAVRPECFYHAHEDIPDEEYIADQHDRRWSAFLQMGVESFSDRELARLGKGYGRAHVRAIAADLDRRGLHFDAYFIFSNAETTAEELVDVLEEVARLKLRHPRTFHIKFPIVQRLVSVFPSASYRRLIRLGRVGTSCEVRALLATPGHPEFDYPLIEHDIPQDPWVEAAVDADIFTDKDRYVASLNRLANVWRARLETLDVDSPERARGERLVRMLDGRSRRLVFEYLVHARDTLADDPEWPGERPDEAEAITTAQGILGDPAEWKLPFQRFAQERHVPRLVVIPTWQCELRCGYCFIPKQEGRVMNERTFERSIDMLLASESDELILQFFGGEALLEYERVQHAITYGSEQARQAGKKLWFVISSNGWTLTEERLRWLAQHPVKFELSIDGDEFTQTRFRPAGRWIGGNSYENSIAVPERVEMIHALEIPYDVIMVVHPKVVDRMAVNFFHIADLGYRRIQLNFALGFKWKPDQKQAFADQLMAIGRGLRERWKKGQQIDMVNLDWKPMRMRLNAEITVDWDGTVYGGNGFLHETEHKERFEIGSLDDLKSFDTYRLDMPTNDFLLEWSYPPETTENNLEVGAIYTSWIRWMQKEDVNPFAELSPRTRVA
jgi:sulfatase maturation enzyme AslB (radical SAM superfamily)/radical SAM superfamily enzyme YgiQ (UPF0313 family)